MVGWTLYSTECPCAECSNAIVQAGIARVVSTPPRRTSNWHRSQLEGANTLPEFLQRAAAAFQPELLRCESISATEMADAAAVGAVDADR